MKKIVLAKVGIQISTNEIKDGDFIGIDWYNDYDIEFNKSVVIRITEGFASFRFDMCMPDTRNCWVKPSAKAYVERALKQKDGVKAYQFNTSKELITWLNE
jgi:hypothetical protein